MKRITLIPTVCFIFALLTSCGQKNEWESLFNGKDLAGWQIICQPQDQEKVFWSVDDGSILCNSLGMKGHSHVWLVSEREFSDFELQFKFQAYSESPGNSGLQFRSRFDPSLEGGWMNGPQVDINPPQPMTWRTGLVYDETFEEQRWVYPSLPDPGMRDEYEPEEHIFNYAEDGDGWNELILICNGMQIKTIVNGIVRTDWDASGILDNEYHKRHNVGESGHFAFQLHAYDDLKIKYKEIKIKEFN